jgi:hypothetical protein
MEKLRIGDFIRLKDIAKWNTGRILHKDVNVFSIASLHEAFVTIQPSEERIPLDEIEPIPINGVDDLNIYYDPIIAADVVSFGETIPVRRRDQRYYYDKFLQCKFETKNFQELIKEKHCAFVHEVQHFLYESFKDSGLKIDAV